MMIGSGFDVCDRRVERASVFTSIVGPCEVKQFRACAPTETEAQQAWYFVTAPAISTPACKSLDKCLSIEAVSNLFIAVPTVQCLEGHLKAVLSIASSC